MIRVIIADDHAMFREGIKLICSTTDDIVLVGEEDNGDSILQRVLHEEWDVVLLDISMPGKSSLEIVKRVHSQKPRLPILILTMHDNDILALRFLKAGAAGFLTKDSNPSVLLDAIREVFAQKRYFSKEVSNLVLGSWDADPDLPQHSILSDREFTVFCQIGSGKAVSKIADSLSLSPQTVSTYRSRIMKKMKFKNNSELMRYFINHNIQE
ncbi:MAG: response regulator transcription factor [Magnetococcales bacterium]|nr:response regulator transcription factor [Magnetococcales bacterium]